LQLANRLDGHYQGRALGNIAGALAKTGEFNRALELVKTVKSDLAKTEVLARFAENLTEVRQLEQVLQMAQQIKIGSMEKGFTMSSIAISLAKAGQFDPALQLASTIKNDDSKAYALYNITGILAKAGQYDRAKEAASTIKEGNSYKQMAFVHIAASLAETGKVADAVQVVSSIDDRTSMPDRWLSETAMVLTEAKQYNLALQMANAITDESEKAWTLSQLANKLVEVGQTELASQAIAPALKIVEAN